MNWIILHHRWPLLNRLRFLPREDQIGSWNGVLGLDHWIRFVVRAECRTLGQSNTDYPNRSGISCVDWHRCSRRSAARNLRLP